MSMLWSTIVELIEISRVQQSREGWKLEREAVPFVTNNLPGRFSLFRTTVCMYSIYTSARKMYMCILGGAAVHFEIWWR